MLAKVSLFALLAVLVLGTAGAWAIIVDGYNDFPSSALIDADGGDTEFPEIDMLDVYVLADHTGIYIGYGHDHGFWTQVQIGIAIMLPNIPGGSFDPWAHQIGFEGVCKPCYIAYVNIDSNWNEWCIWNVGSQNWDRQANILNWVVNTNFDEIGLPYDLLGIDCTQFSQVFIELWVTQEGHTKGPLDLSYNDSLQLSTTSGTIWDINEPVMISCYHCIELHGPTASEASTWGGIKALYR